MSTDSFKEKLLERSYQYCLLLIKELDSLDLRIISTQVIVKQLLRSGTSVGANITEAQAASSRNDFINFLTYALKSANESIFWIRLLMDTKKLSEQSANILLKETTELAKILGASISTLKKNR